MLKKIIPLVLTLALLASMSATLRADEGMWLPDTIGKLPLAKLKARGFSLKPEEVFSLTQPSLKDAVVIIDGGTGEFVSPEGLLLTNHHVAFDGIARVSTPEKNYLENGFTAKSRAEEIPVPGYDVRLLVDARDVTAQVTADLTEGMSPEARTKAIEAKKRVLVEEAQKGKNVRASIVEMLNGLSYYLYAYETVPDVRLVYAPPKSIGFFGGDDDNFDWPRHTGDFTFFRVYTGPDGKPAPYSDKNVPFKPKKHLAISLDGYKEGDFTMVLGYPGRTTRYREASSIEFNETVQLPFIVNYFSAQIEILKALGKTDKKLELELAPQIFGLSNTMKNYEGTLIGLRRAGLNARRQSDEAGFATYLDGKPDLKAKYGEVVRQLDALNAEQAKTYVGDRLVSGIATSGTPFQLMAEAINAARDREKPADQRNPRYADAELSKLKARIPAALKNRQPELERRLLELIFRIGRELPADRKVALFERTFGAKSGDERAAAEAEFARRLVEDKDFQSAEGIGKYFDMTAEQMRNSPEPEIQFLYEAVVAAGEAAQRTARLTNEFNRLRPLYITGMADFKKMTLYPDANRTLRFTYGSVQGYKPFDGAVYTYATTLKGVIEKDTGKEPFDVPAQLKDLAAKRDVGTWVDPRLGDVPVAFLSTNDITGGNSGSPILNGKGELIGLVFDGNYEGLGNDFVFNPDLVRCINVDIRYVLFLAEKMGGAGYLLKELTIAGKAAAAKR